MGVVTKQVRSATFTFRGNGARDTPRGQKRAEGPRKVFGCLEDRPLEHRARYVGLRPEGGSDPKQPYSVVFFFRFHNS